MDCFLYLFYIAFLKFDLIGLRKELTTLFTTDEFRRLVTESLLPLIFVKVEEAKIAKATALYDKV